MKDKKINKVSGLGDFTPVGVKDCEMKCDRDIIMTKDGSVIICKGCMRIVMDNRQK